MLECRREQNIYQANKKLNDRGTKIEQIDFEQTIVTLIVVRNSSQLRRKEAD
jgi:hypothetical protein